jgi:hypothetical protein
MLKFFRHVRRGAGYLEGYGEHPGTLYLFAFILMGGLAGARGGIWGFLGGAAPMALFMVPIYISGCVSRSKLADRDQERLMKLIKGKENEFV